MEIDFIEPEPIESKQASQITFTFGYPHNGHFEEAFIDSLTGMSLIESSLPPEQRALGSIFPKRSCYVPGNRAQICIDHINKSQDSHVVMADTDIGFPYDLLQQFKKVIIEHPYAHVIAARVNLASGLPVFYNIDLEKSTRYHWIQPFDGVKSFDLVGTGIICISKVLLMDLFKKLKHPHFFSQIIHGGWELGDDFSFCVRAREAGYKIYGCWNIYGQHYKGGFPVPQIYPERSQIELKW